MHEVQKQEKSKLFSLVSCFLLFFYPSHEVQNPLTYGSWRFLGVFTYEASPGSP
jgi:hypothetical protein